MIVNDSPGSPFNSPDSLRVSIDCKNATKNVKGDERVTPLSCRHRSLGVGSLKQRDAMFFRASRMSGERSKNEHKRSTSISYIFHFSQ